jgi:hypothetical protein
MRRIPPETVLSEDISIIIYDPPFSDEADFAEADPRRSFKPTTRTMHICPANSGIYYGATPKGGTKISDWGHSDVGDGGAI